MKKRTSVVIFSSKVPGVASRTPATEPAPPAATLPSPPPPALGPPAAAAAAGTRGAAAAGAAGRQRALADLLAAGADLLGKLSRALQDGTAAPDGGARAAVGGDLGGLVKRDESTGQPFLKLPLPPPETLQQVAGLISALAQTPGA